MEILVFVYGSSEFPIDSINTSWPSTPVFARTGFPGLSVDGSSLQRESARL